VWSYALKTLSGAVPMASLIPWRGLWVLDSATGDGGNAINNDLMSLVNWNPQNTGSAVNYLAGYLGVGATPVSTRVVTVTPAATSDKGIVVKGMASQTGDLAEFQNSCGTVLAAITSAGRLSFNATGTAPSNTTTPAAWLDISVGGTAYKLPLYS